MTTTTIQTLASEAYSHMHQITVGKRTIWTTKDDAPEWVNDLCHEAHGDMMPDDWRFQFIAEALEVFADENEDPDSLDYPEADVYNADRLRWLASRCDRSSYCDEAREQFGIEDRDLMDLIGIGQAYERDEVRNLVRSFLENMASEAEDESDED